MHRTAPQEAGKGGSIAEPDTSADVQRPAKEVKESPSSRQVGPSISVDEKGRKMDGIDAKDVDPMTYAKEMLKSLKEVELSIDMVISLCAKSCSRNRATNSFRRARLPLGQRKGHNFSLGQYWRRQIDDA